MSEVEFVAIDLDASLDDIDDLPSFAVFPTGAYAVLLENAPERKEINEHPALEVSFKLMEVLELKPEALKEGELPPKEGDTQSIAFMLDNKFGAGKLKEFLAPIGAHTGKSKISEIIAEMKGMSLVIVQKRKPSKNDPDKEFPELKQVSVI